MLGGPAAHADTFAGLLRIIKDPAAVEASIKKMRDAEVGIKETAKKAREEIASAQKELAARHSAQDARETALAKRDSELAAREKKLTSETAALDEQKRAFTEWEKKTSAGLAAKEQSIDAKIADIDHRLNVIKGHEIDLAVRADHLQKEEASWAALWSEREDALLAAENEHAARAAKLREALA